MRTSNIQLFIKYVFPALISMYLISSCTDGFENVNTSLNDTNNKEGTLGKGIFMSDSIKAEDLADLYQGISTMGNTFRALSYEGVYNNYQITTNLTHDLYAGYFASLNPVWTYSTPSYAYADGWSSARWDHFYIDRSKEYGSLARSFWYVDKESKRYLNAYYITRIYYAFLSSMMTDTYGDIPYSYELIQGLKPQLEFDEKSGLDGVSYQSQEEVYNRIFLILDDALTNLIPGQSEYNLGDNDRCYGGDEAKWLRFGNTLRLRLALRISNIDPERAQKEGEAAMAHPAGLMQSNDDNMKTTPKHAPISLGGEGLGGDENIHALCSYMWSDAGMNEDLEIAYKTQSEKIDPRCGISWYRPFLNIPGTENDPVEGEGDFKGARLADATVKKPNNDISRLRSYSMNTKTLKDDYWFGYSRESVWLSYAECNFLLAEASLRNWDGPMYNTTAYFEDGIKASMRYYHIDEAKIDAYIAGLKFKANGNNPFLAGNKEKILEQIITQKWLAVFPNGNEGWAEFRRTDYPALQLPLINTATDQIPEGKFIKRIQYPFSEYDYNPFCPKTSTGMRLWWDTADTNNNAGERVQPDNFNQISVRRLFK